MPRPAELEYEPMTGSEETQADIRMERQTRDTQDLPSRIARLEADVHFLKKQLNDLFYHQA